MFKKRNIVACKEESKYKYAISLTYGEGEVVDVLEDGKIKVATLNDGFPSRNIYEVDGGDFKIVSELPYRRKLTRHQRMLDAMDKSQCEIRKSCGIKQDRNECAEFYCSMPLNGLCGKEIGILCPHYLNCQNCIHFIDE